MAITFRIRASSGVFNSLDKFITSVCISIHNIEPPSSLEFTCTLCSEFFVAKRETRPDSVIPFIVPLVCADLLSAEARLLFDFTEGISLVPFCGVE